MFHFVDCDAQIVQISAKSGDASFDQYVLPTIPISYGASKVTQLKKIGHQLFHKNKSVNTVTLDAGMADFVAWLESLESENNILIGHNFKSFDLKYLVRDLSQCNLFSKLFSS